MLFNSLYLKYILVDKFFTHYDSHRAYKTKIHYFLDYAPHLGVREVPDPYYGGGYGFERVLDLVEEASLGFLDSLKASRLKISS